MSFFDVVIFLLRYFAPIFNGNTLKNMYFGKIIL